MGHLVSLLTGLTAWIVTICVCILTFTLVVIGMPILTPSFSFHTANAYTTGMKEELDLDSSAYNWAITMFFIGYVM